MEFKQLRSFAAVVKWESFTKAAEVLYLSQPTISAHIRQLEEELCAKLIFRTTKSLEITPKGMEIYEYAKTILDIYDRMLQCCAEEGSTIHLGASTIPSAYLLPEVLPAYRARYPKVNLVVCQDDSQGVIDGLLDGVFDIGMIGMPAQEKSIVCVPFYQDRIVLITPADKRFLSLCQEPEPSIEKLLLESPVILREKGSGSKKRADVLLERLGISESDLQIAARANDQETIKNLVAGGFGVSIISEKAARGLVEEGRVLRFEFPGLDNRRDLYLAYRKDVALKGHVQGFLRFVKEYYQA